MYAKKKQEPISCFLKEEEEDRKNVTELNSRGIIVLILKRRYGNSDFIPLSLIFHGVRITTPRTSSIWFIFRPSQTTNP